MNPASDWNWLTPVSAEGMGVLIDSGLKSAVLLALAFALSPALRRGSAAVRHVFWFLVTRKPKY